MIKLLTILFFCIIAFHVCMGIPNVYGGTYVSDNITTDTVWNKLNSPYILAKTVQVYPGVTLTIEPGVVIEGPGLTIGGELIARGTDDDPITFSIGDKIELAQGCVGTIFDSNGKYFGGSIFEDCIIQGAGSIVSSCNLLISKCSTYSYSIMDISSDASNGDIVIKDNYINGHVKTLGGGKVSVVNNVVGSIYVSAATYFNISQNRVAWGITGCCGQFTVDSNNPPFNHVIKRFALLKEAKGNKGFNVPDW